MPVPPPEKPMRQKFGIVSVTKERATSQSVFLAELLKATSRPSIKLICPTYSSKRELAPEDRWSA